MRLTLKEHFRRGSRFLLDPAFRRTSLERRRIERLPRFTPSLTSLLGRPFEIVDSLSFLEMYEDIWEREAYRFPASRDKPVILDGGANVGLGVAYFKKIYPNSEIIAFEPDARIFPVLKRNVEAWGLQGVTLVSRALWWEETDLPFLVEGSYGGRIARERDAAAGSVRTVRLRNYLDRRIDLLKLDIEEGETEVLEDSADMLGCVTHLFVEYHGALDRPQTLHRLLSLLTGAGFRLNLQAMRDSPRPFMTRKLNMGNDLQVEIYAFREIPRPESRNHDPV
jgi:FkbM family methyltransferase